MVSYVLDSSAILRYLDGEAGSGRVAEIIKGHMAGRCEAVICSLHWGEIAGITCKAHGRDAMELVLSRLSAFGFEVVPADADRAVPRRSSNSKRQIPYVGAFGVELAADGSDRVFVTADFDFKTASRDVNLSFCRRSKAAFRGHQNRALPVCPQIPPGFSPAALVPVQAPGGRRVRPNGRASSASCARLGGGGNFATAKK